MIFHKHISKPNKNYRQKIKNIFSKEFFINLTKFHTLNDEYKLILLHPLTVQSLFLYTLIFRKINLFFFSSIIKNLLLLIISSEIGQSLFYNLTTYTSILSNNSKDIIVYNFLLLADLFLFFFTLYLIIIIVYIILLYSKFVIDSYYLIQKTDFNKNKKLLEDQLLRKVLP